MSLRGSSDRLLIQKFCFYFHRLNVKNITGFENKSHEHKNVPLQAIIYNNEKHYLFSSKGPTNTSATNSDFISRLRETNQANNLYDLKCLIL